MGIEEKVKEFIEKEKLIRRDDRILLGLSGGADSVCLFYLLLGLGEKIGFELRAVHVHHGIRQDDEKGKCGHRGRGAGSDDRQPSDSGL